MVGNLIERARIFQSNLLCHFSFKKMLKQRDYRVFLQRNTGYLPPLKTLQAWRKRLAYASFFSLWPSALAVFDINLMLNDIIPLNLSISGMFSIPVLSGSLFMILASFAAAFDHVIFKRYPNQSLLGW